MSSVGNQKPQLLVSVDHAFFDFNRPFDPPLPEDPDANMVTNASATQFSTTQNSISDGDHLKLKNFKDLKGPSSINLPPLKPLEPAETEIVTMNHSSNGSSNGSTNKDKDGTVVTRKIKACPELPPGKFFSNFFSLLAGKNLIFSSIFSRLSHNYRCSRYKISKQKCQIQHYSKNRSSCGLLQSQGTKQRRRTNLDH